MGQKADAAKARMPQPRVYKPSPLLVKPGKRSMQEALPSALHMGLSVGLSLLVFAIINVSSLASNLPCSASALLASLQLRRVVLVYYLNCPTIAVPGAPHTQDAALQALVSFLGRSDPMICCCCCHTPGVVCHRGCLRCRYV